MDNICICKHIAILQIVFILLVLVNSYRPKTSLISLISHDSAYITWTTVNESTMYLFQPAFTFGRQLISRWADIREHQSRWRVDIIIEIPLSKTHNRWPFQWCKKHQKAQFWLQNFKIFSGWHPRTPIGEGVALDPLPNQPPPDSLRRFVPFAVRLSGGRLWGPSPPAFGACSAPPFFKILDLPLNNCILFWKTVCGWQQWGLEKIATTTPLRDVRKRF